MEFPLESGLLSPVAGSVFLPQPQSPKKPNSVESKQDMIDFIDNTFRGIGDHIPLRLPIPPKSSRRSPLPTVNAEHTRTWCNHIASRSQLKTCEVNSHMKDSAQATRPVPIRECYAHQCYALHGKKLDELGPRQDPYANNPINARPEDTNYYPRRAAMRAHHPLPLTKENIRKHEAKESMNKIGKEQQGLASVMREFQADKDSRLGGLMEVSMGSGDVGVASYFISLEGVEGVEGWEDSDDEEKYRKAKGYKDEKKKEREDENENGDYVYVSHLDYRNAPPTSWSLVKKPSNKKINVGAPRLPSAPQAGSVFVDIPLKKNKLFYEDDLIIIEKNIG